jgi:hypothetical protein
MAEGLFRPLDLPLPEAIDRDALLRALVRIDTHRQLDYRRFPSQAGPTRRTGPSSEDAAMDLRGSVGLVVQADGGPLFLSDADGGPGSSGSPTIDDRGQVVGLYCASLAWLTTVRR